MKAPRPRAARPGPRRATLRPGPGTPHATRHPARETPQAAIRRPRQDISRTFGNPFHRPPGRAPAPPGQGTRATGSAGPFPVHPSNKPQAAPAAPPGRGGRRHPGRGHGRARAPGRARLRRTRRPFAPLPQPRPLRSAPRQGSPTPRSRFAASGRPCPCAEAPGSPDPKGSYHPLPRARPPDSGWLHKNSSRKDRPPPHATIRRPHHDISHKFKRQALRSPGARPRATRAGDTGHRISRTIPCPSEQQASGSARRPPGRGGPPPPGQGARQSQGARPHTAPAHPPPLRAPPTAPPLAQCPRAASSAPPPRPVVQASACPISTI